MPHSIPCPVTGCDGFRRNHELAMCRRCWYTLTPELRHTIWRLYRSKPGGATHLAALAAGYQVAESALLSATQGGALMIRLIDMPRQLTFADAGLADENIRIHCTVCGRPLTNSRSLSRKMGPTCARQQAQRRPVTPPANDCGSAARRL